MCIVIILIISQIIAFGADFFVVYLEDMCSKTFGPGGLVVAQHAHIRFGVCVQMSFESPIIAARPGAIAADESFVALLFRRLIAGLLQFDICLVHLLLHRHLLLLPSRHLIVAGYLCALVRRVRRYIEGGGCRLLLIIEVRAAVRGAGGITIARAFLIACWR